MQAFITISTAAAVTIVLFIFLKSAPENRDDDE
jgi:hypothetical protein